MYYNNIQIDENNLPDTFAEFFMSKTAKIVNDTVIGPNVYNGQSKLFVESEDFVSPEDIVKAVKSLKIKNCEGHDRIPQRILIDGIDQLLVPIKAIFNKIYHNLTQIDQF